MDYPATRKFYISQLVKEALPTVPEIMHPTHYCYFDVKTHKTTVYVDYLVGHWGVADAEIWATLVFEVADGVYPTATEVAETLRSVYNEGEAP